VIPAPPACRAAGRRAGRLRPLVRAAITAYEQWLEQPGADLSDRLDTAMRTQASVYSGRVGAAPEATTP
jgi:hypothetical protein